MQHYRNVDNTMRAYPEIRANWEQAGITADKWVAFYCGTGWRASETWFYAYLQGWERIAVYDGGWFEWSQDPINNPIEIGEPRDEFAA
jgi:thiosulfate/3-mercaptopyruvate sulfurtransferase